MLDNKKESVCLVCIAKDEGKFLDEWLVYHRMIGVDHFIIYDDDPRWTLNEFLNAHLSYTTVIPWDRPKLYPGLLNQLNAYMHALDNFLQDFEWVIFLDVDEFVVLREHLCLQDFLKQFKDANAISLNWHVFGHNGYFDDPEHLITTCLTRRMFLPSSRVKTFTRVKEIKQMTSPHFCKLKKGIRVDANNVKYDAAIYPGKTKVAHINHYQCRSFTRWVGRASRGDVNFNMEQCTPEQAWRLSYQSCLKQFVTTVTLNKNEYIDEFMVQFTLRIEQGIHKLNPENT